MYHATSVKYFSFNLPINSTIFSIFLTIMQLYLFILSDQTKQQRRIWKFKIWTRIYFWSNVSFYSSFPERIKKKWITENICYTEIGSIISITNQVFQEWPRSPSWANSVARLKSRLPGLIGWKSQRAQTREKTEAF